MNEPDYSDDEETPFIHDEETPSEPEKGDTNTEDQANC